jgi:hypothetical protein
MKTSRRRCRAFSQIIRYDRYDRNDACALSKSHGRYTIIDERDEEMEQHVGRPGTIDSHTARDDAEEHQKLAGQN